jgi:hypothetical protein
MPSFCFSVALPAVHRDASIVEADSRTVSIGQAARNEAQDLQICGG